MPKNEEEQVLSWEDHLAAAIKGFRQELKEHRVGLFPEEFYSHRRSAQREMLLAWRSVLDSRIEKMDAKDKEKASPKATRIKVE